VKRRTGDYNLAQDTAGQRGIPQGDSTIKPGVSVELVRPDFDAADSLIFRLLPCLTDEWTSLDQARWMPYRYGGGVNEFTDWSRSFPAAKGFGIGKDRQTMLLYSRAQARNAADFDRNALPYILMYNWAHDAAKKRRLPNQDWRDLVDGRDKYLGSLTELYYMQALLYKRGSEIFVKGGSPPKGAAPGDLPQIVQLTKSAGEKLLRMFNEALIESPNLPENHIDYWERSMVYGDPVHPKWGRFIRVVNPKKGGGTDVDIGESQNWNQRAERNDRRSGGGDDGFRGYDVAIDAQLTMDGRVYPAVSPQIPVAVAQRLKATAVFWDEVIHVPSVEEQCLILAKAFRQAAEFVRRAWADHPEYLSAEVETILTNASMHQVLHWTGERQQEQWNAPQQPGGWEVPMQGRGAPSAALPDDGYGGGYDAPPAATNGHYEEDPGYGTAEGYDDTASEQYVEGAAEGEAPFEGEVVAYEDDPNAVYDADPNAAYDDGTQAVADDGGYYEDADPAVYDASGPPDEQYAEAPVDAEPAESSVVEVALDDYEDFQDYAAAPEAAPDTAGLAADEEQFGAAFAAADQRSAPRQAAAKAAPKKTATAAPAQGGKAPAKKAPAKKAPGPQRRSQ
jgi:hypothetical protein